PKFSSTAMFVASTVARATSPWARVTLHASHHYNSSQYTNPFRKMVLPDGVDIILISELVFTISGSFNKDKVSAEEILASRLTEMIVDYFQSTSMELGISLVSSAYIDIKDGLVKFKIALPQDPCPPLAGVHFSLSRIDLKFAWKAETTECSTVSLISPFSAYLSLPFRMLLDTVLHHFVTWHLVRRYPLIFGLWAQQLSLERPYFDKIFRSISRMIKRSDGLFRRDCKAIIKRIRNEQQANLESAVASLLAYSNQDRDGPEFTSEEAFSLAMELRYRMCLRRPQFKGIGRGSVSNRRTEQVVADNNGSQTPPDLEDDGLWRPPLLRLESSLVNTSSPTPLFDVILNPAGQADSLMDLDAEILDMNSDGYDDSADRLPPTLFENAYLRQNLSFEGHDEPSLDWSFTSETQSAAGPESPDHLIVFPSAIATPLDSPFPCMSRRLTLGSDPCIDFDHCRSVPEPEAGLEAFEDLFDSDLSEGRDAALEHPAGNSIDVVMDSGAPASHEDLEWAEW
ncbi:unnamed protein product, partial [Mycena citricolor]